jgi:hypothetical protein
MWMCVEAHHDGGDQSNQWADEIDKLHSELFYWQIETDKAAKVGAVEQRISMFDQVDRDFSLADVFWVSFVSGSSSFDAFGAFHG